MFPCLCLPCTPIKRLCTVLSHSLTVSPHPCPSACPHQTQQSADLWDEVTTLLFAGHDTQSATLSWTLAELALNPEAQRELRGEVLRALGPEPRVDSGCEGRGDEAGARGGAGGEGAGSGGGYVSSRDAGSVVREPPSVQVTAYVRCTHPFARRMTLRRFSHTKRPDALSPFAPLRRSLRRL